MKTCLILIIGTIVGIGVASFWPIILGIAYVAVSALVAIITILWSILVPLCICVIAAYILWLCYLGITSKRS